MAPANLAYSYDLDGHRTGVSGSLASTQLPAAVSSAVYNADNQLTQWGSTAMTYDADGNTLYDGTNTYTWDARNHLVSANNNGATFVYDGLGRRYGKTMLGANTNFLYDGLNSVQELNGTTPTANLLTGGLDERFTRTDATGTFSYLTDALGSTIALTDTTGNSDVQYSYGPYGSMSITGTSTNSYAYTGREFDGLGIDYYRARYYSPAIDRFISEDPSGLLGGINQYAYTGDDPLDYIDPLGMNRQPGRPWRPSGPWNPGPFAPVPTSPNPGPPKPWYDSCGAQAWGNFALHGGLDALSAIPGFGTGIAATQIAVGIFNTDWLASGSSDQFGKGLSVFGSVTGFLGAIPYIAEDGSKFAEALPGVGVAVGAASVILDGYNAFTKYQSCVAGS